MQPRGCHAANLGNGFRMSFGFILFFPPTFSQKISGKRHLEEIAESIRTRSQSESVISLQQRRVKNSLKYSLT